MNAGHDSTEELREVILAQHRQLDALQREVDDAEVLIQALNALLKLDADAEPFASVFDVLAPLLQFSHALVLVEDDAPDASLRCVAASHPGLVGTAWDRTPIISKAVGGRVIATVPPGTGDAWPPDVVRCGLSPDQPALYLPLGSRDRRGMLMLLRPLGTEGYDRRDITVARKLSLLASHAFATRQANRSEKERRRLHELTKELRSAQDALAYRANYDPLTGLPNRAFFEEQITRATRELAPGQKMALAFIDLDGFKQVNDFYGHDTGDKLLTAVAERLRDHIRDHDILGRISGDEFVLLLNPIADAASVTPIVDRVLDGLREPFHIGPLHLMASASVGLAVFPDHGDDYERLRRNADMAMYSAKNNARGRAAFFEDRIARATTSRARAEQELRRAVADGRFRAVLQPKIDLMTMRVVGFETLARRVGGDGSLGPGADFIELAGDLGLLDQITDIVLDSLLTDLPGLDAAYGDGTSISVNVATGQATDPRRMDAVLARLRGTGRPDRFVVEVTEDALLNADAFRDDVLPLLVDAGVRVSIDDFGTGYAALSRMVDVPADEVKIDRSFVTTVHERARSQVIVRALSTVGHELGSSVVAEGVETVDELRYLVTHTAIRYGQGYLFARPAPAHDLIARRAQLLASLARLERPPRLAVADG